MSAKIVAWPKRPAEERRLERENAELRAANEALKVFISRQEAENAELRKLVEQMESVFRSMLEKPQCEVWRFESEINAVLEAAERGE